MAERTTRSRPERKSTTDRQGVGTERVEEDVLVVPPSFLLQEQVCSLSGGPFLKKLQAFLEAYYDGRAVLGRVRGADSIEWDDTGISRSPHGHFMDYPPIVREHPFTVFKETRPVKRQ
ncbi:MAG TPA: hypothetical protein VMY05_11450 [Acidobacteriota bacterium]|nr:hypothetical protein [Acidobacteriota bacterium]